MANLYIDRLIFPVHTLGPGNRIAIWVMGCPHKCNNCANPELWEINKSKSISVQNLKKAIENIAANNDVHGITITGGEPMEQADGLNKLLIDLALPFDILLFTGYTLNELINFQNKHINSLLEKIDVLIDGRYMEEKNNGSPLRGSDNQIIHYLNNNIKEKYEKYLQTGRQIQNIFYKNEFISIGIHDRRK